MSQTAFGQETVPAPTSPSTTSGIAAKVEGLPTYQKMGLGAVLAVATMLAVDHLSGPKKGGKRKRKR